MVKRIAAAALICLCAAYFRHQATSVPDYQATNCQAVQHGVRISMSR